VGGYHDAIILYIFNISKHEVADGNLKDDLKESINKLQGKEDEIDDQVRTIFKLETESLDLIEGK
jgi:hypothetical protein